MEAVVRIAEVEKTETRSGNTRFLVRSDDGREFTTFREEIGSAASDAKGRRARIEYHEQQRGSYHNVYLDAVAPVADEADDSGTEHSSADAIAWETALEATPWLVGSAEPEHPVDPKELYSRLRPFKDLVAEDIRQGDEGHPADENG